MEAITDTGIERHESYDSNLTSVSKHYSQLDVSFITKTKTITSVSCSIANVTCYSSPLIDFHIIGGQIIIITDIKMKGLSNLLSNDSRLYGLPYIYNILTPILNRERMSGAKLTEDTWKKGMGDKEVAEILGKNIPFMIASNSSRPHMKEYIVSLLRKKYTEANMSYILGQLDKQVLGMQSFSFRQAFLMTLNVMFYKYFMHDKLKNNVINYTLMTTPDPEGHFKNEVAYSILHQSDKIPRAAKLFYSGKTEKTIKAGDHIYLSTDSFDDVYIKGDTDFNKDTYCSQSGIETNTANMVTRMFNATMQDFANTAERPITLVTFVVKDKKD